MRADAERDAIGLAVNDAAAPVIDAERVGGNLRHHRLKPLPERRAAGDDIDHAGRIDGNSHAVGRAEPALLDKHRKPDPDKFAARFALGNGRVELGPAGCGEKLIEQSDIVAAVVLNFFAERLERPRIRHFLGSDRIAAAQCDAIDLELVRDCVDQPFAHEGRLVAAGRAVGGSRRLVGQAKVSDRAIGRHPIRPGQDPGRHVDDARRMRTYIGALIVEIAIVDGENDAIGVERGADLVYLLA